MKSIPIAGTILLPNNNNFRGCLCTLALFVALAPYSIKDGLPALVVHYSPPIALRMTSLCLWSTTYPL